MFDAIFKNASFQNAMLSKLKGMAKESNTKFFLIDLSADEIQLQEFDENKIMVNKETFEFLKKFYDNNKNLADAKL